MRTTFHAISFTMNVLQAIVAPFAVIFGQLRIIHNEIAGSG
jgi:hypothetical protein